MEITFRPLDQWPDGWRDQHRAETRRPSPFRSKYEQTLRLLREELKGLDATTAHLQLDVASAELRQDGMLRARASVGHPGVILTAVTPARTLVVRTDRFYSQWVGVEDWHVNLRAIALGLVDLRRMDRYGLNDDGAQYAGFAALPPARAMGTAMTVEQAARLIAHHSDDPEGRTVDVDDDPSFALVLYKEAARNAHPDRHGGDGRIMADINEAREFLAATYGS